jgi:hypothetical protein
MKVEARWMTFATLLAAAGACSTVIGEPIGSGTLKSEGHSGAGGSGGSGSDVTPMMSPEEAEEWCEWYVFSAYPLSDIDPPPTPQKEENGLIRGYAALYCYDAPFQGACLMRPTVEDCVRNILHASCEATVEQLTTCVEGMIEGNLTGVGCPLAGTCDAFAQAANCEHTVVSVFEESSGGSGPGCALHVE